MRTPSIKVLAEDLKYIKHTSAIEFLKTPDDYIEVRLQVWEGSGIWVLHTGDPQYDTDHTGFWGYGEICLGTNCRKLAKDLIEQVKDAYHAYLESNKLERH